jgi:hypothetical protein
LWVSSRRTVEDPWGTPTNLGPTINSGFMDNVPALSRDEHWLFFNSDRPGGFGGFSDIWVSWRPHVHDDFGWQPPVNLGPTINTALFDAGASFFENEDAGSPLLFFGSGDLELNQLDYVSTQAADGSFGPAELIPEVSSPTQDGRPHVRFDGREMILNSDRSGTIDLWVSLRDSVFDRWPEPANLGPTINGPSRDFQAYLSSDGKTLYFASDRPGGLGGLDLYMSTRTKLPPD